MTAASGEIVLFVHSTGTGPLLWGGVPDGALGSPPRRRLHPANVGYPPGAPVPRGRVVSVQEDAAYVVEQLRMQGADGRVHLVAHSYGVLVALHAIPAIGDRLASAFFYEPVTFGGLMHADATEPEAAKEARDFAAHPWFLRDLERGGREEWLEYFIDYWNRPGWWQLMPPGMKETTIALGWKMFQEVRACFLDETRAEAWRLPAATTIAFGERTTRAAAAMARELARGRDHVRLVEIAGTGHMAPLTHPAKVHAAIAEHLTRVEERQ